jgi:hypothetical protein
MAPKALVRQRPEADRWEGLVTLARLLARQALREQLEDVDALSGDDASSRASSHADRKHEPR